ncbi:PilW family protein [Massilia sp. CF038]|uniref:PilW family protein n=1 Tax=Massilia sp. CF038 TaxID=1881045 RepID=UPI000910D800|nr:PilW family protein [Massilia sp. CF038]SHG58448.1 type IV pilus assembly protein PilW [Massilia sp. CF038]
MRNANKGFTLVEIMVAMVIGLIAMVVIMQVFNLSESRKRATTGGSDAQANGAIAFMMIERDLKMAGWGLDTNAYKRCTTTKTYCNGNASCGGAAGPIANFTFASVQLLDGGTKADTITVQYYSNPALDTYRVPAIGLLKNTMNTAADELTVSSVTGCAAGDLLLIQEPDNGAVGQCSLVQATTITPATLKITHDTASPFNPPQTEQIAANWQKHSVNSTVACIKKPSTAAFFQRQYSVNSTQRILQRSDNSTTPPLVNDVVTPEIIDMQTQYGIAPVNSQTVDTWVDPTGTWANPSPVDAKRIKAIRVAIVARSAQYEKPAKGEACLSTTAAMAAKWSTWAKFTTASYPADWNCYQHKSFETVIPLRNVIWSNL